MSTSVVRKKWGMGPSDAASRLAMVLRICVRGTSSNGAPVTSGCGMWDAGCDWTTGVAAAGASARDAEPSTSRLTTRPPGPDPLTSLRSTPASRAIRLASGEAFTRVTSAGAGSTPPASRIPLLDGTGGAGARGSRRAVAGRVAGALELLVVGRRDVGLRVPHDRGNRRGERLELDGVRPHRAESRMGLLFLDHDRAVGERVRSHERLLV